MLAAGGNPDQPLVTLFGKVIIHLVQENVI